MDVLDFRLIPLRDYLPAKAYEAACRQATRLTFDDGQTVHFRGDDSPRLCIVASGMVRIGRYHPDGSFNLLSVLGPGAHYGDVAMQRKAYTQSAFAVGRCEIDLIEGPAIEDLLDNEPGFAIALWRCNTARLNALLELYDDARTLPIMARLAKVIFLHTGQGELPNGIACLQRDLADLLGVSQVSVGNALKELERAGLVATGYRSVVVLDKAKLKVWLQKTNAI